MPGASILIASDERVFKLFLLALQQRLNLRNFIGRYRPVAQSTFNESDNLTSSTVQNRELDWLRNRVFILDQITDGLFSGLRDALPLRRGHEPNGHCRGTSSFPGVVGNARAVTIDGVFAGILNISVPEARMDNRLLVTIHQELKEATMELASILRRAGHH